jgi:hypothetical protein
MRLRLSQTMREQTTQSRSNLIWLALLVLNVWRIAIHVKKESRGKVFIFDFVECQLEKVNKKDLALDVFQRMLLGFEDSAQPTRASLHVYRLRLVTKQYLVDDPVQAYPPASSALTISSDCVEMAIIKAASSFLNPGSLALSQYPKHCGWELVVNLKEISPPSKAP